MSTTIPARYTAAHASPSGPGDARPTALQVLQDEDLLHGSLAGKTFLITGANEGCGLETARALHMTGARIFVTTRSAEKNEKTIQSIVESNGGERGGVEGIVTGLDDLVSVENAAKEFEGRSGGRLNVLVCSAGAWLDDRTTTRQGFAATFGVNHVGHFALFQHLRTLLLNSSTPFFKSRVVMVASVSHRAGGIHFDDLNFESREWNSTAAYCESKTANIYMANQIERSYGSNGLHAWSLQPGGMLSTMVKGRVGRSEEQVEERRKDPHFGPFWKNAEQGAATSVWAAVSKDLEGKGGKYLESMQVIGPFEGTAEQIGDWTVPGYAKHAYREEDEVHLWEVSETLVGSA